NSVRMIAEPTNRSTTGIERWNASTSSGRSATRAAESAVVLTSRSAACATTERGVTRDAGSAPGNPGRGGHDLFVERRRCDQQPAVVLQPPACRKIEPSTVDVRDAAARFLHDQRASSVVPDLLHVTGARQPEVQLRIATGHNRVLGLAVHAQWFF